MLLPPLLLFFPPGQGTGKNCPGRFARTPLFAGMLAAVFAGGIRGTVIAGDPTAAADRTAPRPARQIQITDRLPYGQTPIDYESAVTNDAVARLNAKLAAGQVQLGYDPVRGYLPAVLQALRVPVESQLLVYSKTALHPELIEPKRPRAVYFNDRISVAWVPGSPEVEVMAVDPLKGCNFYVLKQQRQSPPRFVRGSRCLACHAGSSTLQVPGWMVRSFLVTDKGKPVSGFSRITHETAFGKRWGGWYVTGRHGKLWHRGNLIGEVQNLRFRTEPHFAGNLTRLNHLFKTQPYLSAHSDLVAHLVLDHQAHGLNLLTRVGYEARLKYRSDAEEQLLRYLLFVNEAPLKAPVKGTSGYRRWFEAQGPFDSAGRSLRQFDLKTRLFRYRLSYLIYSPLFDGLPKEVRVRLYRRLRAILRGENVPPPFDRIPRAERQAIYDIVRETKHNLPADWKRH